MFATFLGLLNSICLEVMKEKFEFKFNIMFNSITGNCKGLLTTLKAF